uniref:Uncharacterized protein n=1 Tax=Anopheles dirus TaxID=7168 RepID=A0A182N1I1_9DIPT
MDHWNVECFESTMCVDDVVFYFSSTSCSDSRQLDKNAVDVRIDLSRKKRVIRILKAVQKKSKWTIFIVSSRRCIRLTLVLDETSTVSGGVWAGFSAQLGPKMPSLKTKLYYFHPGRGLHRILRLRKQYRPTAVDSNPVRNLVVTLIAMNNFVRSDVERLLRHNDTLIKTLRWPRGCNRPKTTPRPDLFIRFVHYGNLFPLAHVNRRKLLQLVAQGEMSPIAEWCANHPEQDLYTSRVVVEHLDSVVLFGKYIQTNYIYWPEIDVERLTDLTYMAKHFAIDSLLNLCQLQLAHLLRKKQVGLLAQHILMHVNIPCITNILACHNVKKIVHNEFGDPTELAGMQKRLECYTKE